MRVVILTTETTHHAYFVREIARHARIEWVLVETQQCLAPFETIHPYEVERDDYERRVWFNGNSPGVGEFAETWVRPTVNDGAVHHRLRDTAADAVLVFGTGRLSIESIASCGVNVLNLHGGNPAKYRGLDSHLWAIYHRDFGELTTTLHRVSPQLDRGDIVEQLPLQIAGNLRIHELRRLNTEVCVRLSLSAIRTIEAVGELHAIPQSGIGRYYSHMPSILKSICVDRFANYTRSLA